MQIYFFSGGTKQSLETQTNNYLSSPFKYLHYCKVQLNAVKVKYIIFTPINKPDEKPVRLRLIIKRTGTGKKAKIFGCLVQRRFFLDDAHQQAPYGTVDVARMHL